MKICAVIPAYNEEATIGKIIQETKKYIDDIFVVNNSSTDSTEDIARECGAIVIDCSGRRGYGASQYAGQQYAIESGYDYILQLDADGQHDPAYIPRLLQFAQSGNYDIVIGSRFLNSYGENLSYTRKIGIIFFSKVVSILGNTQITDITSGFKVYKASSLKRLSKPCDTHPAVEQMLEMAKKSMIIKEVPVEMPAREVGESHLSLVKFAFYPFRAIWLLLKVMLSR